MKKNIALTLLALTATFGAMPAHATTCSFGNIVGSTVENSTVAITGITNVLTGAALSVGTLTPTACILVNDNISGNYPVDSNIGLLGQGVLNGGSGNGSNTQIFNPYFLPPSNPSTGIVLNSDYLPSPLTYPTEKLVNDKHPGWINLYSTETGYGANPTLGGLSLVLRELMTISVTGANGTSGTWTLNLKPNIITQVQNVLGRNAFDHLAFILKSTQEAIVYDFDFNVYAQYFAYQGEDVPFDYVTPYNFTGTWKTTDFTNQNGNLQGLSHLEIWARDPDATQDIPEPVSLALFGLGLVGLGLSRRKTKQQ